jgi:hypothetical protein
MAFAALRQSPRLDYDGHKGSRVRIIFVNDEFSGCPLRQMRLGMGRSCQVAAADSSNEPGVYAISMTSEPYASHDGAVELPLSSRAFEKLLDACPFLEVDGRSATLNSFRRRLQQFWLPDEPILYIGKAGTSLSARTRAYYSTQLGATGPHAGGWWLKMLTILPELTVHYARHTDAGAAEDALIDQFARQLSPVSRANLFDRNRIGPFANLRIPGFGDKAHGLGHYKVPRTTKSTSTLVTPLRASALATINPLDPGRTPFGAPAGNVIVPSQTLTPKDRNRSYLRIPARSKYAFPAVPATVTVFVRGEKRTASWHPGNGRSGRLGLGNALMSELVVPGFPMHIEANDIDYRILDESQ